MKEIYSKEIFYEGHEKFLDLLYYIENKKKHVDLFSIVLIAFFDDIMRKEHSGTEMLIDVESFF